jgi:mercuric reductase
MNEKVSHALVRLNQILPLARNQRTLGAEAVHMHQTILRSYADTGAAPLTDELAKTNNNVADILSHLDKLDLIVLDDKAEIIGAYPFTSEARVHRVEINDHDVHCMCALDALAISPVFNCATQIHSRCALTSEPVLVQQSGYDVLNQQQCAELFLAMNWAAASDKTCCANSLCKQMNFISGTERAHEWLQQSDQHELFTLPDAIVFAAQFFMPLLPRTQAA